MEKQKDWFELLKKVSDTPIYTTRNWLSDGIYKPGKQVLLGRQLPPIDHRTIFSNEVILELDARSYSQNYKYAKILTDYMNSQEIPHYCFWSGNKSVHIHIFLDIDIKEEETIEKLKSAVKKGCNIHKEIRVKFAREMVEQSGLSLDLVGKIVDIQKLQWNDMMGKSSLIRVCGGHNKKVDKVDPSITHGGFKTYYPDNELPKTKPKDNTFDDVEYPQSIETFSVEESFVYEICNIFDKIEVKTIKKVDYKEGYLALPCVHKLLEGVESGSRSMGARVIAIACRLDGKSKEEANAVMQVYVNNCPQVPEPFEIEEAKRWKDWIYGQNEVYWSCGNCVNLDCCDKTDCGYFKEENKEELAIFEQNNPLKVIKEALDILIVGEDELKIQLFLLYLTKEFNPEWCIMLDGTASSGKSHVMKKVASLFGEEREEFFVFSRMTKSVLNHAELAAAKWSKKIVIIEELQGARDVVEQLRLIISEKMLNLLETVEDKDDNGNKIHREKEKCIKFDCLFVTCNAEESDEGDQLASRSWILNTDQSPDHTKLIMNTYLSEFGDKRSFEVPNIEQIRSALKFLRKPKRVIFPFAEELEGWLSNKTVRGRRDIKKLITLIQALAYFFQKDRIWVDDVLIADWRDVFWAFELAGNTINASSQGVGSKDLEAYEKISANLTYVAEFEIQDVMRWLSCGSSTARKIMANLSRAGFFENQNNYGQKAKYKATSIKPVYLGELKEKSCANVKVQVNKLPLKLKSLISLKKAVPSEDERRAQQSILELGAKDPYIFSENGTGQSEENKGDESK